MARGGEAEPLLDRVIQDELHPDDADDVHEPRLREMGGGSTSGWMEMGMGRVGWIEMGRQR